MSLEENLREYERLLRKYADLGLLRADMRASEESNSKFRVSAGEEVERAQRRGELLARLHSEGLFGED